MSLHCPQLEKHTVTQNWLQILSNKINCHRKNQSVDILGDYSEYYLLVWTALIVSNISQCAVCVAAGDALCQHEHYW